jgi:hypothetical protein
MSDNGAAAFNFAMKVSSRVPRPSHGSSLVARAGAAGSLDEASPRTSGRKVV